MIFIICKVVNNQHPPLKKQTKKKRKEKEKEQQQKTNVGNVIVYSLHCT